MSQATSSQVVDTIKFINGSITYKPGWTLTAMLNRDDLSTVVLQVDAVVPYDARTGERTTFANNMLSGGYVIHPGPREKVIQQVLNAVLEAETHEVREFFRVDDEIIYDPHDQRGEERFRKIT